MSVSEIFDTVGGFVALGALVGVLLLLPLYLSQRRDVKRMRTWMEAEPSYPGDELATSERALDNAEGELERILGTTLVAEPGSQTTPSEPMPAATRVTHERPALERITMERAALVPHPRWRRFVARVTRPRVMVAIGAAALLLGVGAIYASQQLLSNDEGTPGPKVAKVVPGQVKVAVLNGTAINGLAGLVSSDLDSSGYDVIATTSTTPGHSRTVVLYADGQKPAAQKVARNLGVNRVQRLDKQTRDLAGGADVVVIAGEDRA
jgi:hypothetical protein